MGPETSLGWAASPCPGGIVVVVVVVPCADVSSSPCALAVVIAVVAETWACVGCGG